jgi:hypothetical protein
MTVESKFDIDKLILESITILNASIENNAGIQKIEKDSIFDLQFTLRPGVNLESRKMRVVFECSFQNAGVEQASKKLDVSAKFEIGFIFNIQNINELIKIKNNQELPELDNALSTSIANIVYSTSRGIIYSRCLGTVVGNIILPIMPTDTLLKPFVSPRVQKNTLKSKQKKN